MAGMTPGERRQLDRRVPGNRSRRVTTKHAAFPQSDRNRRRRPEVGQIARFGLGQEYTRMLRDMRRRREEPNEVRIELTARRGTHVFVLGCQRPGFGRGRDIRGLADHQEIERQDPEDTDEQETFAILCPPPSFSSGKSA